MNATTSARAAWAALALVSAACAPAVRYDRDETIAVPQGASWAWGVRDTAGRFERDPGLSSEIVNQRFHRALEAEMQAQGFHQADDAAHADFILTYHMGLTRPRPGYGPRGSMAIGVGAPMGRMRPWGWSPYDRWGWGWYGPPMWGMGYVVTNPYPVAYRDGQLIVLLRQRASGDVAWEGRTDLDNYDWQTISTDRVKTIAHRVMEHLR
jgi:hypothetical protein